MTSQAISSVGAGDTISSLTRTVSQEQVESYAQASGDFNPIHVDPEFAISVGLQGAIAHGLLEMGILADAIGRWAGSSAALQSLDVRFSKPLVAGDSITCTGRVVAVDDERGLATLEVEAVSSRGERVLTNGRAIVRLSR